MKKNQVLKNMAKEDGERKTPTREQIQRNFDRLLGTGYWKGAQPESENSLEDAIVLGHFVYDYEKETETYVPAEKS